MIYRYEQPSEIGKLYVRFWDKFDWDMQFGVYLFTVVHTTAVLAAAVILSIAYSVFFLFLLTTLVIHYRSLIKYTRATRPIGGSRSGGASGLYPKAYKAFRRLREEEPKAKGIELLQRVWDHEVIVLSNRKSHDPGDCTECDKRVSLLKELEMTQTIPAVPTDDIDSAESFLTGRRMVKELM